MRLALRLPLAQLDQTTVKGSVQLAGNDVRLRGDTPLLVQSRGRVDFTHKGVQVIGAAARALGGEIAFDGGTQPDGSLRFSGQGTASADGLRRAGELAGLARLATSLQGQAAYRLQLGIVNGQTEVLLTSNLAGMALNLPAPLAKAAEASLPLRVQSSLQADSLGGAGLPRSQLRVELGNVVQALFVREHGKDGPRVLRSAVAINSPLPAAVPGGHAVAEFNSTVSLDAWRSVLAAVSPRRPGSGRRCGLPAAPDPPAGARSDRGGAPLHRQRRRAATAAARGRRGLARLQCSRTRARARLSTASPPAPAEPAP